MQRRRRLRLAGYGWLTMLIAATAILAWLWIASHSSNPKRLFHSTDRYCSYVSFEDGKFLFWYDGGDDVRTFQPRDFKMLGIFCDAHPNGKWQFFSAGIHGGYACGWLAVLWVPTIWLVVARPRLRRKRGLCLRCGYNLSGVRDAVCPECGEAHTRARITSPSVLTDSPS